MQTQASASSEKLNENQGLAGQPTLPAGELLWVCLVIGSISAILFWRFLPLPHADLNFFTEPAYQLAKLGRLAAPGSQAYDLTFQKGIYCYPPGYFLILAAWLRLFGLSANSLLAYTHLVHAAALILLWILLRKRYRCERGISALILLAMFPRMAHGRPDLTAVALGLAAWMALPEEFAWGRLVLSGCLAGAALLVSPAFGIATISALAILVMLRGDLIAIRFRNVSVWLASAGILFLGTTGVVVAEQHAWPMAYVQFKINSLLRGSVLNVWPDFHLLYTWVFAVVPFVLIALLPAALIIWKGPKQLRHLAIAFLGSTLVWLVLNKAQLLLEHHCLYPAKSVFIGTFYSVLKWPAWLRVAPLVLLCAILFYDYKADFLYLTTPLRLEEQSYAKNVHPQGIAAVDSLYFARFYQPGGQVLNYEVSAFEHSWKTYRDAIPAYARKELLAGLADRPEAPTMFVVSSFTAAGLGEAADFVCTPPSDTTKLRFLHHIWNLPADPYALTKCTKRLQ